MSIDKLIEDMKKDDISTTIEHGSQFDKVIEYIPPPSEVKFTTKIFNNKETKKEDYEDLYGPIDTPSKLTDFYVYSGRQQGKTIALVESLPDAPCIVVTHSTNFGRIIKDMIREYKSPGYNIDQVKFVSDTGNMNQQLDQLKGYGPIFFDNAVFDMMIAETTTCYNNIYYEYPKEREEALQDKWVGKSL